MNMILFMCKVLHEAGTAAMQAERENGETPWSDANAARIFGFLRRNPYCSMYSFSSSHPEHAKHSSSHDNSKEANPTPRTLHYGRTPYFNA